MTALFWKTVDCSLQVGNELPDHVKEIKYLLNISCVDLRLHRCSETYRGANEGSLKKKKNRLKLKWKK